MVQYSQGFVEIIGALLILVVGLVVSRVVGNTLRRVIKASGLNKLFSSGLKLKFNAEQVFSSVVTYALYFVTFLLVLSQLGVSPSALKIVLLIFVVFVVILALFASRDLLPNLVASIYLMKTKKIKVGSTLRIKGFEGKVLDLNLLETRIRTKKKEILFIPNSLLNKELIRTWRKK